MKRLRRFNESVENTLDKEYIKDCFVEFLDNSDNYTYTDDDEISDHNGTKRNSYIEIHIDLPVLNEIDFNKIVEMNNILNEIYSELQTCIDKVKIKYNYVYEIEFEFDESISTTEFVYTEPTAIVINYEI
jgi:hypothetical protein